jgi:protein-tyrosine phosphatase
MVKIYFKINYRTVPGENIYVLGNTPELGNWNIENGLKLHWQTEHDWSHMVKIEHKPDKLIEYKYVVFNNSKHQVKWEEGENRELELSKVKQNNDEIFLKEVWEHRLVKLRIKYDCVERNYLSVCVYIPGMIYWRTPARMVKIIKRDPFTKSKTEFWQKEIYVKHDLKRFRYRYVLTDSVNNTEIWEREPDRKCELLQRTLSNNFQDCKVLIPEFLAKTTTPTNNCDQNNGDSVDKKQQKFERRLEKASSGESNKKDCIYFVKKHNEFIKVDVNFVADFFYNQIDDRIFVGPYPQTTEEIDDLLKGGIKSVLNLQTKSDMRHRSINWEDMKEHYELRGIKAVNFEIVDMSPEDMEIKAYQAAKLLKELMEDNKVTYVHCTAGIGRAPQTVVAYYIFFENHQVEEAIKFVKERRPMAWINKDAIWGAYHRNKDKILKKSPAKYCSNQQSQARVF